MNILNQNIQRINDALAKRQNPLVATKILDATDSAPNLPTEINSILQTGRETDHNIAAGPQTEQISIGP